MFKTYGSYMFPFGTQVGLNFYLGSGTPLTTYVNTINGTEVFVEGRGDMGRTDVLNHTDFLLSQEVPLGSNNQRLRFELQVLNMFNQQTSRHQYNYLNRIRLHRISTCTAPISPGVTTTRRMIRATPDGANAFDPRLRNGRPVQPGHAGSVPREVVVLTREAGFGRPRFFAGGSHTQHAKKGPALSRLFFFPLPRSLGFPFRKSLQPNPSPMCDLLVPMAIQL